MKILFIILCFYLLYAEINALDLKNVKPVPYSLSSKILRSMHFFISTSGFYRYSREIEITGNEGFFGQRTKLGLSCSPIVFCGTYLSIKPIMSMDISINLDVSTRSRYNEYFKPKIFKLNKASTGIELIFKYFSINTFFLYGLNNALNYTYEDYSPPVLYELPSYPIKESAEFTGCSSTLPYPAFLLGGRNLPIYYENAVDLRDAEFGISLNIKNFLIKIGMSNGEDGLDANSAKSAIFRLGFIYPGLYQQKFTFFINGVIGNRGSVPVKTWGHIYSFFTEKIFGEHFNFTIAMEGILSLHGIKNASINPYVESFNNYPITHTNIFIDLYLYGYGKTLFKPDELPNLIDKPNKGYLPPLIGGGFFIYMNWKIPISILTLKPFIHFSLYDPEIRNEKRVIYKFKYRAVAGSSITFFRFFSFLFSYTYTKDPVFDNYVQFYEAEYRSYHPQGNYDIFVGLSAEFLI